MQIQVLRDIATPLSTSSIVSIDNVAFCYGLEPPVHRDDVGPLAIIASQYNISVVWSPKNKMYVPLVNDVPHHTAIEIHPGNFPKDTLDCLLVGMTRSVDKVENSRFAFSILFGRILHAIPLGLVTIEYVDAYNKTTAATAKETA